MAINFPSTAGQPTDGSYTYNVAGLIYSWDGSSWRAAGAGASATDKTLFSVTNAAAGSSSLAYNSNTGVFSYTPPDLSSYLTAEADTLANVLSRGATTNGNDITFDQQGDKLIFNTAASNPASGGCIEIQTSATSTATISGSSNQLLIYNNDNSSTSIDLRAATHSARDENADYYALFNSGSVRLYHPASAGGILDQKFETTSTGVTITGALTAGGLTYPTSNGTSGQVLTSNGAGNVTWSTPTGLQSRTTSQITNSIAAGASANNTFSTPSAYALMKIETSHAAWVTLYSDTTSRTNDASRSEDTDPTPGSGVLAEVITTGAVTQLITPGVFCFNSSPTNATYAKVVNKSGATNNITVTLTYVKLEG